MSKNYQLARFGYGYFMFAPTKEGVIRAATLSMSRPWWFLRLIGWYIREYPPWAK